MTRWSPVTTSGSKLEESVTDSVTTIGPLPASCGIGSTLVPTRLPERPFRIKCLPSPRSYETAGNSRCPAAGGALHDCHCPQPALRVGGQPAEHGAAAVPLVTDLIGVTGALDRCMEQLAARFQLRVVVVTRG